MWHSKVSALKTLRPKQNGRHFADDIFKCNFVNENVCIPIQISLKFVPKVPIKNIPALVQIIGWRRAGDKPLSEPMIISLPTHICVTRSQWVNAQRVIGNTIMDQHNVLDFGISESVVHSSQCGNATKCLTTHHAFSWKLDCVLWIMIHWGLKLLIHQNIVEPGG